MAVERWPAMLTGPDGERLAWKRLSDVPHGWTSRNPLTQAEIEARYPEPTSDDPEPTSTSDIRQHIGPNGETWAGRGRKPRWLLEAEAANGDGA